MRLHGYCSKSLYLAHHTPPPTPAMVCDLLGEVPRPQGQDSLHLVLSCRRRRFPRRALRSSAGGERTHEELLGYASALHTPAREGGRRSGPGWHVQEGGQFLVQWKLLTVLSEGIHHFILPCYYQISAYLSASREPGNTVSL